MTDIVGGLLAVLLGGLLFWWSPWAVLLWHYLLGKRRRGRWVCVWDENNARSAFICWCMALNNGFEREAQYHKSRVKPRLRYQWP